MKRFLFIFFSVILLFNFSFAQNINGRLSSSFYTLERYEDQKTSNTYLKGYQSLYLNFAKDKFALKTNMLFESEFLKKIDNANRFRLYHLYLEANNLFDIVSLKLGRQPLYNGVVGGSIDGINVNANYNILSFNGFFGSNVPAYQSFELIKDLKDNYVFGGKLSAKLISGLKLSLAYYQKNYKPSEYTAIRLDENFNPVEYLIQLKSNQFKFGSAEAFYEYSNLLNANVRYDYDFNYKKTAKLETFARVNPINNLGVELYFNYREPLVRYNSIYSVFDFGNTYEIDFGTDYKVNKFLTVNGRYGYVKFKDDNSSRVTLSLNSIFGSMSYRKTLGYAGELDALSFYAAHSFVEGLITPSIGVSYTTYKLSPTDEKNSLISILAGTNIRPYRSLSFDIQGQYLSNKIYKDDARLFIRINYWFNSNLNLL